MASPYIKDKTLRGLLELRNRRNGARREFLVVTVYLLFVVLLPLLGDDQTVHAVPIHGHAPLEVDEPCETTGGNRTEEDACNPKTLR